MIAMLPLANSDWLLVIIGVLVLLLLVFMVVVLHIQDAVHGTYDENEDPPQHSCVRIIHRPYDYEADE